MFNLFGGEFIRVILQETVGFYMILHPTFLGEISARRGEIVNQSTWIGNPWDV
jgi:hypothetical protein